MDIVVYLALVVLGSVFLFSLFILIIICRRHYAYNHLLLTRSLRFSKLQQENLEDVELLGPHISRVLDHNQWIEIEAMTTGLLQHCVAVLKLCQTLAEQIAEISLSQQQQQQQQQNHAELNEFICKSAARIVPRFEALLGSMAEKDMDIRVIEARVGALISTCWALIAPLSLASPKHKGQLMALVQQMDYHMASLQMALGKATELEEQQQQQQQVQVHLADGAPSTSKQQQQNPEEARIANPTENKLPPNGHVVHQHCDENERKAEPTTTTDQSMTMTTTRTRAASSGNCSSGERDGEKKSATPMADEAPAVADPAISR